MTKDEGSETDEDHMSALEELFKDVDKLGALAEASNSVKWADPYLVGQHASWSQGVHEID